MALTQEQFNVAMVVGILLAVSIWASAAVRAILSSLRLSKITDSLELESRRLDWLIVKVITDCRPPLDCGNHGPRAFIDEWMKRDAAQGRAILSVSPCPKCRQLGGYVGDHGYACPKCGEATQYADPGAT